jgi:hypothetical protein
VIAEDERLRYAAALRGVAEALTDSRDSLARQAESGERTAVAAIGDQIERLDQLAAELAAEHAAG